MSKRFENDEKENEDELPVFRSKGKNSAIITIITIIIVYFWYIGYFNFLDPLGTTLKMLIIFSIWTAFFVFVELGSKKSTLKYLMRDSDRNMKGRSPHKKRKKDDKEK